MNPPSGDNSDDVIFEIMRVGAVQRVAAIHAATGIEVVVQTPLGLAPTDARALAARKLKRALRQAQGQEPNGKGGGRRGKVV